MSAIPRGTDIKDPDWDYRIGRYFRITHGTIPIGRNVLAQFGWEPNSTAAIPCTIIRRKGRKTTLVIHGNKQRGVQDIYQQSPYQPTRMELRWLKFLVAFFRDIAQIDPRNRK